MQLKSKFNVGDYVLILPYKDDDYNKYGIVNYVLEDGWVHVSNMNMPFYGTVSRNFHPDELQLAGVVL